MSFVDSLLGRAHPSMIGLDISTSSVKLVELGQSPAGEFIVERFASEPFEKGWITDGQIEKFDEVADAVRRVVTKSGTRTKNVVMAMPQSAVITKKIMLPAGLREEELELQVESEANQYIPFSLDEVSLDFCVIGPSPTWCVVSAERATAGPVQRLHHAGVLGRRTHLRADAAVPPRPGGRAGVAGARVHRSVGGLAHPDPAALARVRDCSTSAAAPACTRTGSPPAGSRSSGSTSPAVRWSSPVRLPGPVVAGLVPAGQLPHLRARFRP